MGHKRTLILSGRKKACIESTLDQCVPNHPAADDPCTTPTLAKNPNLLIIKDKACYPPVPDRITGGKPCNDLHMIARKGKNSKDELNE